VLAGHFLSFLIQVTDLLAHVPGFLLADLRTFRYLNWKLCFYSIQRYPRVFEIKTNPFLDKVEKIEVYCRIIVSYNKIVYNLFVFIEVKSEERKPTDML